MRSLRNASDRAPTLVSPPNTPLATKIRPPETRDWPNGGNFAPGGNYIVMTIPELMRTLPEPLHWNTAPAPSMKVPPVMLIRSAKSMASL